jgi:hypothetical protein
LGWLGVCVCASGVEISDFSILFKDDLIMV